MLRACFENRNSNDCHSERSEESLLFVGVTSTQRPFASQKVTTQAILKTRANRPVKVSGPRLAENVETTGGGKVVLGQQRAAVMRIVVEPMHVIT